MNCQIYTSCQHGPMPSRSFYIDFPGCRRNFLPLKWEPVLNLDEKNQEIEKLRKELNEVKEAAAQYKQELTMRAQHRDEIRRSWKNFEKKLANEKKKWANNDTEFTDNQETGQEGRLAQFPLPVMEEPIAERNEDKHGDNHDKKNGKGHGDASDTNLDDGEGTNQKPKRKKKNILTRVANMFRKNKS
ncbi:hypothetical protein PMAYCL1PPCAC_26911 [Pristionchus mayeri]|uniref:Uncharacterized protein n=1 Tax=Pristionchus mayeri TaxID=1317129 RepID=A0AAN5IBH9_9BILA|nr:hypothetical protein PMAYCL1PPCAC_26911 [Pristionchus mayeri]